MDPNSYPDVYFRPEYGQVETGAGRNYLSIVRLGGAFQIPLIVRDLADGWKDAASPYGYSGAYAHEALSDEEISAAWASSLDEMREREIVSVFLRHSPMVPQARMQFPHVKVVEGHLTVAMDVRDPDACWSAMRGRCRTAIRKAAKSGAVVEVRPALVDDLKAGSDFRRLYEETMTRTSAKAFYQFADAYYERLGRGLGERLLLASGRSSEGETLSAALFMHHERLLHYHLSGSRPEATRMGLNNLVIWEAAKYAQERGVETVHLGGGIRQGDSLFEFKSSFSPHRLTYSTSGIILSPQTYDRLSAEVAATESNSGFFPAYRA